MKIQLLKDNNDNLNSQILRLTEQLQTSDKETKHMTIKLKDKTLKFEELEQLFQETKSMYEQHQVWVKTNKFKLEDYNK